MISEGSFADIVESLTADRIGRTPGCGCIRKITTQAAWIESQSVSLRIGGQIVERGSDRAQTDGHIPERTAGDTSRPIARRNDKAGSLVGRNTGAIMGKVLSITTDGSLAAVEEWRTDNVVGVFTPVDVWLVAFVAALRT